MTQRRIQLKALKRRPGSTPERRTIVVFTEGVNSEPDYLRGMKRLPHIAKSTVITVEIAADHGVPRTLVECAVAKLQGLAHVKHPCGRMLDGEDSVRHADGGPDYSVPCRRMTISTGRS